MANIGNMGYIGNIYTYVGVLVILGGSYYGDVNNNGNTISYSNFQHITCTCISRTSVVDNDAW